MNFISTQSALFEKFNMITGIVTESIYKVATGALQLGENVSGYKLSMAPTQPTVDKTDLYVILLEKWKLSKYLIAFADNDWDEVGTWKHLTDEILTNDLGLSSGAVHKFRFHYTKWCDVQSEIESEEAPEEDSEDSDDNKTSADDLEYNQLNLRGNWNDNVSRYKSPATWTKDSSGRVRYVIQHSPFISINGNYYAFIFYIGCMA